MIGPDVPAMNEVAISNVLVDIDFLEAEFTRIGRGHLNSVFAELHSVNSPFFFLLTWPINYCRWSQLF
jgi:hypothetical protein